jgi:hypothetical protein
MYVYVYAAVESTTRAHVVQGGNVHNQRSRCAGCAEAKKCTGMLPAAVAHAAPVSSSCFLEGVMGVPSISEGLNTTRGGWV